MQEYSRGYVPPGLTCLASVETREGPEIAITEVWRRDSGEYVLATADPCFGWDGWFEQREFGTLDELLGSLPTEIRLEMQPAPSMTDEAGAPHPTSG